MSLHVYRSNHTERLVARLADLLNGPADAFAKDTVVVHSRGLEQWLSLQIADKNTLCANVDWAFPDDFVNAQLTALTGTDRTAWSVEALTWAIHAELEHPPAVLARWIAHDGAIFEGRRRIELSRHLAELFHRYALYRSDDVGKWTEHDPDWQKALFTRVAARIDQPGLSEVMAHAIERLAQDPPTQQGRIALFTVSTLPPAYVRFLGALGEHLDLHLFALCPSRATSANHPLLRSMGKLFMEFQAAVLEVADEVVDLFEDPPGTSTLAELQRDLLDDTVRARPLADDTLRIHGCHGPMRQVQVLRDRIIEVLDADDTLQPHDILVMTPDIETYAPLLHAVFRDGVPWEVARSRQRPPEVKWGIADQGPRTANPVASALLDAFDLLADRVTASSVVDLFAYDGVRRHHQLQPDDLGEVRKQVNEAGVRWGVDGAHRAHLGQPANADRYTWRGGLDRALFGQALSDPQAVSLNVLAGADIEGKDGRRVLAAWTTLAEHLLAYRTLLLFDAPGATQPLSAWKERLLGFLNGLVGRGGWQGQAVRAGLASLLEHADPEAALDAGAVRSLLQAGFSVSMPGRSFLSGGVTFCQLVPMRSVPFQVVFLLGMDDEAFPRAGAQVAHDLIESDRRAGDRTPREDDRSLFLETLVSTRKRLEILYASKRLEDNRAQPPAIPVGELLDAVDATFSVSKGRASDVLRSEHRLHAFASPGFDGRRKAAATAWHKGRTASTPPRPFLETPLPAEEPGVLELRKLVSFIRDPIQWFCERRLGVWLRNRDDVLPDREPVAPPDGLQAYLLRDALVRGLLEGRTPAAMEREQRENGKLQVGTPGEVVFEERLDEAREIVAKIGPGQHVDIDLQVQGYHLVGRLHGWDGTRRLTWRAGGAGFQYQLALWVEHLALACQGYLGASELVGRSDYALPSLDRKLARERLDWLVALFADGQRVPLLFHPDASHAFRKRFWRPDQLEPAAAAAEKAWRGWKDDEDNRPVYDKWVLGDESLFLPSGRVAILPGREPAQLAEDIWGRVK